MWQNGHNDFCHLSNRDASIDFIVCPGGRSVDCYRSLGGKKFGRRATRLGKDVWRHHAAVGHFVFFVDCGVVHYTGEKFFGLFSQEAKILQYAQMTMLYLSVITFTQISMIIYSGCLRGAGDVKYIAMVSLICITFASFGGLVAVFCIRLRFTRSLMGIVIEQTVRLILVALRFRSGKWMYHRIYI